MERIKELQRYVGATQDGIIGKETMSRFALKFGKTREQTIHFFAQVHHESGGFTLARENMNYSALRISQIFGVGKHSAKVTPLEAARLAGKPYELAERVYGLGNPSKARELGNTKPGDGYKYRGGGAIQITGGDAYKRFGDLDLYNNPDKVADSAYYFTTAVAYFDIRNIWRLATDTGKQTIERVTRAINGGTNGLRDRESKTAFYASLWDSSPTVVQPKDQKKTTANLNLRRAPGTSSERIRVLPQGSSVTVLQVKGAWSEVDTGHNRGWVSNQYLA